MARESSLVKELSLTILLLAKGDMLTLISKNEEDAVFLSSCQNRSLRLDLGMMVCLEGYLISTRSHCASRVT